LGGHSAVDYLVLEGGGVSVIIEANASGAPFWRYWGPQLPAGATPPSSVLSARAAPTFALDIDFPLSILPTFGLGWFYESALLAHCSGRDFAHGWTKGAIARRGAHAAEITIEDDVAMLAAIIDLTLDPQCGAFTIASRLVNRGGERLFVDRIAAACLPLPREAARVLYFTGRHNREFLECEDALSAAVWRRENRRGLTSHDCPPVAFVRASGANEHQGDVYAATLAWSGNHFQMIEPLDDGRRQWLIGEAFAPGEIALDPGEAYAAPEVIAVCSSEGMNGASAAFHHAIRKRIKWPGGAMRPRPVHINTWEGFYFNHDEASLRAFVDDAAKLGVERFVLDDGWFKGRNDSRSSLGDWTADARKYPNGLKPLAEHVVARGMEFGLWVEPEMVNPDSDLYRAHPDWALKIPGRAETTGRNQLVLNLAHDGVADYLYDSIAALLRDLPIAYLKWDHNRDLASAGDADCRPAYARQTRAAYALMARLRVVFPHVEIEACAGGGGRIDAGIVQYAHRFWTSDNLDSGVRLSAQRGFMRFMPPEVMGAHVGASPAHGTGRLQSLDFMALVATPGHFGLELDPRRLDEPSRARLKDWIAFYKTMRGRIHGAQVWQGDCGDHLVWQAHGARENCVVFLYRTQPTAERQAPALRLPFADAARDYRVRILKRAGAFHYPQPRLGVEASLEGEGLVVSGAWLRHSGVSTIAIPADGALVLECVAT
jgi:alpha-galactosidase